MFLQKDVKFGNDMYFVTKCISEVLTKKVVLKCYISLPIECESLQEVCYREPIPIALVLYWYYIFAMLNRLGP